MSPLPCLLEKPNPPCLAFLLQCSCLSHASCVNIHLVEPGSHENSQLQESLGSIVFIFFYFPVFRDWEELPGAREDTE